MKMLLCAVYDQGVGAYLMPFFCRSKSEAIRSFSDAVADDKTQFCRHPEDYGVYCLGAFDDQTGEVRAIDTIEKLITGIECRAGE